MELEIIIVEKFGENPYYEKWGRGRPSKEARRQRERFHIWNKKHIELYPELYPSLIHLLNNTYPIVSNIDESSKVRKVKIMYVQRGTENYNKFPCTP